MASAPREFALDFNRGIISGSTSVETTYTFKTFKSGDSEWLAITLVKANPSLGPGKLSIIPPTGLTLKCAIGLLTAGDTGTVYTSVTLSIVGNQFVGKLPMNVEAIENLFADQSENVPATIEFELTDDGEPRSLDFPVEIRQHLIGNTLVDTVPPDVALGKAEAAGTYVPRIRPAGYTEIWIDHDTDQQCLVYLAGGTIRVDPIS